MTDRLNKSSEAKLNRSYKSFDVPHPKTLSKSLLLTNQKRISWALVLAYPFRHIPASKIHSKTDKNAFHGIKMVKLG